MSDRGPVLRNLYRTGEQAMAVQVKIPTPYRKHTDGQRRVECPSGTVQDVLAALVAERPALKGALCGDDGEVRSTVRLFVDGTDIRGTGEMATDVPDGATVTILPPVAGA